MTRRARIVNLRSKSETTSLEHLESFWKAVGSVAILASSENLQLIDCQY